MLLVHSRISGLYCKLHGRWKWYRRSFARSGLSTRWEWKGVSGIICFVPRGSGACLELKGVLNKHYSIMEISVTNLKTPGCAGAGVDFTGYSDSS